MTLRLRAFSHIRAETVLILTGLALAAVVAGRIAVTNPDLAILLGLAVAYVIVAVVDLRAGVVLFTTVAFLNPGTLVSYLIAGVIVLVVAWVAHVSTAPTSKALLLPSAQPAVAGVLFLFLGWAALGVSWAANPAVAQADTWRYILNIALVVIVYTAVRSRHDAWWVAGGFVLGGVITSLYGFVVPAEGDAATGSRFVGGLGDPNVLAALLVCGGAIALAAAGAARKFHRSIAAVSLAAATLCLVGFMLTVSRGGLLALGAALLAAIVVGGRWRMRVVLASLIVALSVATYIVAFASGDAQDRFTQTSSGELRVQESRFTTWEIARRMAADNPVLGVGTGNFEESSIDYLFQPGTLGRTDDVVDTPLAAHQTYLHIAAELGIPGIALFLMVVGLSVGSAVRAANQFKSAGDEPMELLSRAVVIAMVALLSASMFISLQSNNKLWLLLALGPALLGLSQRQATADSSPS